jgi:hypothetical protein
MLPHVRLDKLHDLIVLKHYMFPVFQEMLTRLFREEDLAPPTPEEIRSALDSIDMDDFLAGRQVVAKIRRTTADGNLIVMNFLLTRIPGGGEPTSTFWIQRA